MWVLVCSRQCMKDMFEDLPFSWAPLRVIDASQEFA